MLTEKYFNIGVKIKFNKRTTTCNEYGQYNGYVIDQYSVGEVEDYKDKYTQDVSDDIVKVKIKSGDRELSGKHVWVKTKDCPKSSISHVY